eukprot:5108833-Pyramimonas_sp.AAC.1
MPSLAASSCTAGYAMMMPSLVGSVCPRPWGLPVDAVCAVVCTGHSAPWCESRPHSQDVSG